MKLLGTKVINKDTWTAKNWWDSYWGLNCFIVELYMEHCRTLNLDTFKAATYTMRWDRRQNMNSKSVLLMCPLVDHLLSWTVFLNNKWMIQIKVNMQYEMSLTLEFASSGTEKRGPGVYTKSPSLILDRYRDTLDSNQLCNSLE